VRSVSRVGKQRSRVPRPWPFGREDAGRRRDRNGPSGSSTRGREDAGWEEQRFDHPGTEGRAAPFSIVATTSHAQGLVVGTTDRRARFRGCFIAGSTHAAASGNILNGMRHLGWDVQFTSTAMATGGTFSHHARAWEALKRCNEWLISWPAARTDCSQDQASGRPRRRFGG
jgi:hypothetical protein